MTRSRIYSLLALLVAVLFSGCCWRKPVRPACCPDFVSQKSTLAVTPKSIDAGVTADLSEVPTYDSAQRTLLDQIATGEPIAIDLEEVICLAAQNSELAEMIERERHLIQCQPGGRCQQALDLVLQGEAEEQRNSAAGAAGEIFLGLVQIEMQRQLIDESQQRLDDLEKTVAAADDAGFATADGKNEVEKARIRLQQLESKLNATHQQLTYQLNQLINCDSDQIVKFRPVHEIQFARIELDVLTETQRAETNRPGIQAVEAALRMRGSSTAVAQLLNVFDSRLGIQLPANPIKKLLLRNQLIENVRAAEQPDTTPGQRKQQASRIVEVRKQEAKIAASKAMLDMQAALERVTIANADVERLQRREKKLGASKELDAKNAYLKLNQNWAEMQQAKSDLVAAAIEYETATLQLGQAQGMLLDSCRSELCGCQ